MLIFKFTEIVKVELMLGSVWEKMQRCRKIKLSVYVLCVAQPEESNFQQFFLLFFQKPLEIFFNLFS